MLNVNFLIAQLTERLFTHHLENTPAGLWERAICLCWHRWPGRSLPRSPDAPRRSLWTSFLCSEGTRPILGARKQSYIQWSKWLRSVQDQPIGVRTHLQSNWWAAEPEACGWQYQTHEVKSPWGERKRNETMKMLFLETFFFFILDTKWTTTCSLGKIKIKTNQLSVCSSLSHCPIPGPLLSILTLSKGYSRLGF